jgi:type I restriction enzyme R subunit
VEYRDYVAGVVRRLFLTPASLRAGWRTAPTRAEIAKELARRGIDLDELAERTDLVEADAFDVLVHVAWSEPVLSRHERARRVRREYPDFFAPFQPKAREVLDRLLERYAVYGVDDLTDLWVLQLEPINEAGTIKQIADEFGGGQRLREAVGRLQSLLYAA